MTLFFTRAWILVSTFLVATGWVLSAAHRLDRNGYGIALAIGAVLAIVALWKTGRPEIHLRVRRYRQFLPLAFLILTALAVLGGLLYAPNNYDALSYRLPRPLHWLAEGRWHWIRALDPRMNTRAADCEWVMTPLLLFARSERWLWLGNAAMFATLPGLIFSVFTRVGVPHKVAWRWMWVLPTGYVFVLQAGGISTDLAGAFYTLAAVALALRASSNGNGRDLWLSTLAIALSQGVKAGNAPLALVWALAAWPAWKNVLRKPLLAGGTALLATLVSYLPSAVLNQRNCGDWSGAKLEIGALAKASPAVLVSGNTISLLVQNFVPPIFPLSGRWNDTAPKLFSADWRGRFASSFEAGGQPWRTTDMQIEDQAPQGLGVSFLLVVATITALVSRRRAKRQEGWWWHAIRWSPWVGLLVFIAKVGFLDSGRLIAAYYPFLPMPILAAGGQAALSRGRWWRGLAAAQLASVALMLVILPSRPLWPALTVLGKLTASHPDSATIGRTLAVYQTYRVRSDALAAVRDALPPENVIGLIISDDLETSLWRPFGARRFIYVFAGDTRERLQAEGVQTIVVDPAVFAEKLLIPPDDWLRLMGAEIVNKVDVLLRVKDGPVKWTVVRLRPHGDK